ncbi:MAG: ZIP family metal transporter, partial [Aquificota bacterium]
ATLTGLVEPVGGLVGASLATFSLIGGFVLMMLLDVLLG